MFCCFAGCADKSDNPTASSVSKAENVPTTDAILPAKEIGGVILLGGYESYEHYIDEIKLSEYSEDIPQLAEISEEDFVSTDGGFETYAIIPPPSANSICVYELVYNDDLSESSIGDLIYDKGGEAVNPIILRCNVSDLMPDHFVVVLYDDGSSDDFSLSTSLKDGTVIIDGNNKNFEDLTKY